MATHGLVAKIGSLNEDKVTADGSTTYAVSTTDETVQLIEMAFTGNTVYKRENHLLTISNPSTESAITVDVFNMIEDFDGIITPARIDTFTVDAKVAHVDPTEVWFYDKSANTYAADVTDFTDADADDVPMVGHAAAEVDDYIMIGHVVPFNEMYLDISTAMTDKNTLVLEYATHAGVWTALDTNVTMDSVAETAAVQRIAWELPDDWGTYNPAAIGGSNPADLFYVRIRCSAFTEAGIQGAIKQGKISTIYNTDVIQRKITGLFMGTERVVLAVQNDTVIGATTTIAGAGEFTVNARIEAI